MSSKQATLDIENDDSAARLENQHEHEAVPLDNRKSLGSVAASWYGMPIILTTAIVGGQLTYSMGFARAIIALVVGTLILFVYVGALSYIAGETGENFGQTAAETFGKRAVVVPTAILSSVVIGWFAFQTGLTGATLQASMGWNVTVVAIIAGILYTALTVLGHRGLTVLGYVAAPLFILMAIVALVIAAQNHTFSDLTSFQGAGTPISMGVAITTVIALFADAGTMTADFTRFAKNGRQAVFAAFTAFPVAYLIAGIVGAVIVAIGAGVDPANNGGSFLSILTSHGWFLSALGVFFVFVNLGSVCAHCLYNGSMGWSHITGSRLRPMILILGGLGTIAAAVGIWALFANWLTLLGVLVPPIGGAVIADHFIRRINGEKKGSLNAIRWQGVVAWVTGSVISLLVNTFAPGLCVAVVGLVVAAILVAIFDTTTHETSRPTSNLDSAL